MQRAESRDAGTTEREPGTKEYFYSGLQSNSIWPSNLLNGSGPKLFHSIEKHLKIQAAREELERQQNELKELLEEQKNAQSMEAEERAKLQEEIEAKQREIEEMRSVIWSSYLILVTFL